VVVFDFKVTIVDTRLPDDAVLSEKDVLVLNINSQRQDYRKGGVPHAWTVAVWKEF
jgi:hypothetical protein